MSPPQYSDLGKKPRDVLNGGYTFGLMKLKIDMKTKSCISFNVNAQSKQEDGLITGGLETKYNWEKYGICVAEKFNTENDLTTELTFNKLLEGLKMTADATVNVNDGFKDAHLGLKYGTNFLACSFDVSTTPLIGASLVLGPKCNWCPGVELEYNAEGEGKLTKVNFALDYIGDDFVFHTNVDNGNKFGGLIYKQITDKMEAGLLVNFGFDDKETEIGVGAKYTIDADASVCSKVNNKYEIGLGYKQQLREGISMCLSALIDCKDFKAPEHKLGLSLEFQA